MAVIWEGIDISDYDLTSVTSMRKLVHHIYTRMIKTTSLHTQIEGTEAGRANKREFNRLKSIKADVLDYIDELSHNQDMISNIGFCLLSTKYDILSENHSMAAEKLFEKYKSTISLTGIVIGSTLLFSLLSFTYGGDDIRCSNGYLYDYDTGVYVEENGNYVTCEGSTINGSTPFNEMSDGPTTWGIK